MMGEPTYLFGWKALANHAGVSVSTLKRWHYEKSPAPIPFQKTCGGKRQNSVGVRRDKFEAWLERYILGMSDTISVGGAGQSSLSSSSFA